MTLNFCSKGASGTTTAAATPSSDAVAAAFSVDMKYLDVDESDRSAGSGWAIMCPGEWGRYMGRYTGAPLLLSNAHAPWGHASPIPPRLGGPLATTEVVWRWSCAVATSAASAPVRAGCSS